MRVAAVILASGSGTRTGLDIPKQFLKVAGQPVLAHTLKAFLGARCFDEIIIVSHPEFLDRTRDVCTGVSSAPPIKVVPGGETRQQSSYLGILACPEATHVVVHDAVRPLISPGLIRRVVDDLKSHDAIDVCVPATDTIVMKSGAYISSIPPRTDMMLGQTPQAFSRELLLRAHQCASADGIVNATDDCALVLRLEMPVFIELGEKTNMKITYLDDIYLAERLFQVARLTDSRAVEKSSSAAKKQRALVLGGTKGIGRSIADVLRAGPVETFVVGRNTRPSVDVSSRESVQQFLDDVQQMRFKFDYFIYCPGALIPKRISEYADSEWDLTYETNLKGVFRLLQHVPDFLNVGGHFLVLGSSSYSLGRAGYSAYSSSKAALINLIQAAADEWPEYRFNVVSPQRTATDLRTSAFGSRERAGSLLDPHVVAEIVMGIMDSESTGMNFDLRVDAPLVGESKS